MARRSLWFLFLPFLAGHFISYFYRNMNAIIYPQLAEQFQLTSGSLGLLTSLYFFAFALAQIPIGILLDRFGPRPVQATLLLVASLGAWLFASAQTLSLLLIARGMIGFGVAGSLMSAIKAATLWLPKERLSLATSGILAVGGLGALASTAPLHLLMQVMPWQGAFYLLSLLTLLVSLWLFFGVKGEYRAEQSSASALILALWRLYRSPQFWRIALYSLPAHGIYMAFSALWIAPWLREGGIGEGALASILMFSAVAMVLGSLTFGALTDRLRAVGIQPFAICGLGIVGFLLVQLLMVLEIGFSPTLLALLFSFFGTASAMNYAVMSQSVPKELSGRATTAFNLLIFLTSFFMQWLMGGLLQYFATLESLPITPFRALLIVLILFQIPAILLWLTLKPWQRGK